MKKEPSGYNTLVKIWGELTAEATKIYTEIDLAKAGRKRDSEAKIARIVSNADASVEVFKEAFINLLNNESADLNSDIQAGKNTGNLMSAINAPLLDKINAQIKELKSIVESGNSTKSGRGEKFWAEFITSNQDRVAAITKDMISLAQDASTAAHDIGYSVNIAKRMGELKSTLQLFNTVSKKANKEKRNAAIQKNIDWFARNIIANGSYALLGLKVVGTVTAGILAGIGKMAQIIAALAVAVVAAVLKFVAELLRSPLILLFAGASKIVNPKKTNFTEALNQVGAMWAKYASNLHNTYNSFINLAQSVSLEQHKDFGKEFGETLGKLIMGAKDKSQGYDSLEAPLLEEEDTRSDLTAQSQESISHEDADEIVKHPTEEVQSAAEEVQLAAEEVQSAASVGNASTTSFFKPRVTPEQEEAFKEAQKHQVKAGVAQNSKHASPK